MSNFKNCLKRRLYPLDFCLFLEQSYLLSPFPPYKRKGAWRKGGLENSRAAVAQIQTSRRSQPKGIQSENEFLFGVL